ncbi:MAG: TonB family protein, partial [Gammaproteobacteria bacterium]
IFAYLVTSLFWLNPLLWIALRKLDEEAENSCDSSVLRHGQSETNYAEHLLGIARTMQRVPHKPLLAQMMLGKSILPKRIHRILENDMVKARTHRLFALPLLLLTTALLAACTSARFMDVESVPRPPPAPNRDSREAILPITNIAPQYPLRAAYGGIEGWALLEFTVLENGDVDPDSIVVADAEPADIFNRSAIRAAQQFKFEPIAGSAPREITGVQYLFRYDLGEPREGEGAINRSLEPVNSVTPVFPAQADAEGIAGANVWTVFHVTRAGTVQDVMVNYSSNDMFNESAIAAARQLQFPPRSPSDRVSGNVRGDTTGLVRAQYLFRFER